MTVTRLHNILAQLIVKGHGRKPVCVDKSTFSHPCEIDGAMILDVECVQGPVFVSNADGDGGLKENKDGSESGRMTVLLLGDTP